MKQTKKLLFTGERYIPEVTGQVQLEHLHRYAIAKELISNKNVLDIACGEGYGSSILASVARNVIGVDISEEAIEHAQSKYKEKNLEFRLGSCSAIPVEDNSVDVVVSFETIEHHDQHEDMMIEIKRVLTNHGLLIISSPNKREYSDIPKYSNPFHVKELYREELIRLLKKYFSSIEMLSQRVIYGSAIVNDDKASPLVMYEHDQVSIIDNGNALRPIYDLALASCAEIPELGNSIFSEDLKAVSADHDKHIEHLSTTLDSVIEDRDARVIAIEQIQNSFEMVSAERDKHIEQLSASLDSVIADRDAKAAGLEQIQNSFEMVLAERDKHIEQLSASLNSVIADRDAKAAGLEQIQNTFEIGLAERDKHIEQLSASLNSVIADRDAKAAGLEQIQNTFEIGLAERDKHIEQLSASLNSVIADRDAKAAGLEQIQNTFEMVLAERDKHIEQLSASLNSVIADRDAKAAGLEQIQNTFEMVLAERDKHIEQLSTSLNSVIADRDAKAAGLEQIQNSFEMVLAERDKHMEQLSASLNTVIADRDAKAAGLEQIQNGFEVVLAERDKHMEQLSASLNTVIADRDAKTAGLEQIQNSFEIVSAEREKHIERLSASLNSIIADRDAKAAGLEQIQNTFERVSAKRDRYLTDIRLLQINTGKLEQENSHMKNQLASMLQSRSWRITAPLRKLRRIFYSAPQSSSITKELIDSSSSTIEDLRGAKNNICEKLPVKTSPMGNSVRRILLVSYYCPTRAHAGGLRILDLYSLIRGQCPDIQLDLFTHHRPDIDWNLDDLNNIFDNVYLSPSEDLTPSNLEALSGFRMTYEVVDLQFHQTAFHIDAYKQISKKVIFTPMESLAKVLYIELRSIPFLKTRFPLRKAITSIRYAAEEIFFLRKVDEVVCVSKSDAVFLRAVTSMRHIRGIDTGISQFEFADALSPDFTITAACDRPCRVIFIAYFGSDTNVKALRWYLDNVHALVSIKVPDYKLTIVGRGDLSSFSNDSDGSIELVGEVPAIGPYIKEARVGIAPALGGSGFRGKVNQYAVLGVPSVVSPVSFKGLLYKDGVDIYVAESAKDFADRCIQLLTDTDLNDRMGQAARKLCMDRYTWQSKWKAIQKIYKLEECV